MCLNNSHPVASHGSRIAGQEYPVARQGRPVTCHGSRVAGRDSGRLQLDSGLATRDPRRCQRDPRRRERGFSIITAIFLVVVLAMLGVFIVSVTG